jgi:hypothetical protein
MYGLADSRRHETVGGLRETRPLVARVVAFYHDGLRRGVPLVNERRRDDGLGAAAVHEHRVDRGLAEGCKRKDTCALDDGKPSPAQKERRGAPERLVVGRDEDPQELFPGTRGMNKAKRWPVAGASTVRLAEDVLSVGSGGGR